MKAEHKKPRGRPPTAAVLVDGRWVMTPESLALAAERLERHRTKCRERYRATATALKQSRPDLFTHKKSTLDEYRVEGNSREAVSGSELPLYGRILQSHPTQGDSGPP